VDRQELAERLGPDAFQLFDEWSGSLLPSRGRELAILYRGPEDDDFYEAMGLPTGLFRALGPAAERALLGSRLLRNSHGVLVATPELLLAMTGFRLVAWHPVEGDFDIWVGDTVTVDGPDGAPVAGEVLEIDAGDMLLVGIDPAPAVVRVHAGEASL